MHGGCHQSHRSPPRNWIASGKESQPCQAVLYLVSERTADCTQNTATTSTKKFHAHLCPNCERSVQVTTAEHWNMADASAYVKLRKLRRAVAISMLFVTARSITGTVRDLWNTKLRCVRSASGVEKQYQEDRWRCTGMSLGCAAHTLNGCTSDVCTSAYGNGVFWQIEQRQPYERQHR